MQEKNGVNRRRAQHTICRIIDETIKSCHLLLVSSLPKELRAEKPAAVASRRNNCAALYLSASP